MLGLSQIARLIVNDFTLLFLLPLFLSHFKLHSFYFVRTCCFYIFFNPFFIWLYKMLTILLYCSTHLLMRGSSSSSRFLGEGICAQYSLSLGIFQSVLLWPWDMKTAWLYIISLMKVSLHFLKMLLHYCLSLYIAFEKSDASLFLDISRISHSGPIFCFNV